jgi:hypothetical protein
MMRSMLEFRRHFDGGRKMEMYLKSLFDSFHDPSTVPGDRYLKYREPVFDVEGSIKAFGVDHAHHFRTVVVSPYTVEPCTELLIQTVSGPCSTQKE